MAIPDGTEVYSTHGDRVLFTASRSNESMSALEPCNHEEADTRLMVHVSDAASRGYSTISIRTNDTDVVVLAVSVVEAIPAVQLWITFGLGKNVRHIPAHAVAASLGPSRSLALPMFHALTGCDTVSFFRKHGKKSAWDVWQVFPELTPVLQELKTSAGAITEESKSMLEAPGTFI